MAHVQSHEHNHSREHQDDPYVVDWEDAAPRLAVAAGVDSPWYASVAATLVTSVDRITATCS